MTIDRERLVEVMGFYVDDDSHRVRALRWHSGGCRPATRAEVALWDALVLAERAGFEFRKKEEKR